LTDAFIRFGCPHLRAQSTHSVISGPLSVVL
jgi:hypothetical protein